jgi:hypothetical protein
MLLYQCKMLSNLRNNRDFTVIPADKNLGPCIMERETYIRRALQNHLNDNTTYQQLSDKEAEDKIQTIKLRFGSFLEIYRPYLETNDYKFIVRSIKVKDPLAKFYLTAKVHKVPWKTRLIISISGSLLHGLGMWVDKMLQPYARSIPSYIKSLYDFKELITKLPTLPPNAYIFTADAVSMYTNIETIPALKEISNYIRLNKRDNGYIRNAINAGLDLVMKNNIFEFGDTKWLQLKGTAMGVLPSCCYETIYFSNYESEITKMFPELYLYKRYIDDVFGIWMPQQENEDTV